MKIRIVALVLVALVVPSLTTSAEPIVKPAKLTAAQVASGKERRRIANRYIQRAVAVAKQSGDPLILKLAAHLRNQAVIVLPYRNGFQLAENPPRTGTPFFLLVLMPTDINTVTTPGFSPPLVGASFHTEMNLTALPAEYTSITWGAISLLREAWYARSIQAKPDRWTNEQHLRQNALAGQELENRILLAAGGARYRKYLETEVARLEGAYRPGYTPPLTKSTYYPPELDQCFGPAPTSSERTVRSVHVWVHAVCLLIERKARTPQLARKEKADFIWALMGPDA